MSFTLQQYSSDASSAIFYDEYYAINALGLLAQLKKDKAIKELAIKPSDTVKYQGDFYGLLDSIRVPKRHHRMLLELNSLHSSSDYKGDTNAILVIDTDELDSLATMLSNEEDQ